MKHLSTAAAAALLIVATLLIFLPELRTLPMRVALHVLWVGVSGINLRRLFKAGVLTKTPGQIFHMAERPKVDLLLWMGIMVGALAMALSAA